MDIYFKKYLKYKNKYLGLLNQQGGRHTIDQISMTKNGYIFDYDLNKYIEEPIYQKHIHLSRAVLINNTIYDYLYLLNWIIISKDGIARDPINKEIISVDDLELMYRKLKKGNEKFIDDPEDQQEDQQEDQELFEKTTREYNIKKEQIINNTTREYNKQNLELMDSIRKKIFLMSNYGTTEYKTSLKNIDLIGLDYSLKTKEKLLNSLDYKIKDDIISNSYDSMFKILLLTKEQIIKLYSYHPIKFYKILNLTINQINKLLSYDDKKQELILNFDNYYINIILSIYDISEQKIFIEDGLKNIDKDLKDLESDYSLTLNSLDSKIKDDILSNSFNSMMIILDLTKEKIIKLYSYYPITFYKILNLTKDQINKLLSFDDKKQELILKFDNNYINNILSIDDISIQDGILKNVSYKIISFLLDILEYTTIECVEKLVLLTSKELEILYNSDYTPLKIKELTNLDIFDIKIKIWESVNL